jgi:hypothetical protein
VNGSLFADSSKTRCAILRYAQDWRLTMTATSLKKWAAPTKSMPPLPTKGELSSRRELCRRQLTPPLNATLSLRAYHRGHRPRCQPSNPVFTCYNVSRATLSSFVTMSAEQPCLHVLQRFNLRHQVVPSVGWIAVVNHFFEHCIRVRFRAARSFRI